MTNTKNWKYQHADNQTFISEGRQTDSRGLLLRQSCGYTHVHMGDASGWLQIQVAIRKVKLAEGLARIAV